jgi:predicted nucleotidyltransferase
MRKGQRKRSVKETRTAYQTTRQRPNRSAKFQRIIRALRANDPDIIEIVQFGSSVYAPRLARDVDLLVVTRAKKEYDVYLDATGDYSKNVDVVVKEPGENMGADIALSILASSKTLFGNGLTREEARKFMPIPTYASARNYLTMAAEILEKAHQTKDAFFRDGYYRAAFDFLFDAARYTAMTFLATDETRWGDLPKKLPSPFNTRFREIVSKLHVQFKYDGNYPKDKPDEAFQEWHGKVTAFIDDLAARSHPAEGK